MERVFRLVAAYKLAQITCGFVKSLRGFAYCGGAARATPETTCLLRHRGWRVQYCMRFVCVLLFCWESEGRFGGGGDKQRPTFADRGNGTKLARLWRFRKEMT